MTGNIMVLANGEIYKWNAKWSALFLRQYNEYPQLNDKNGMIPTPQTQYERQ